MLNEMRMSFDDVLRWGSRLAMSPPWATTRSRFCVVCACASCGTPGSAAAAPAAAILSTSRLVISAMWSPPRRRLFWISAGLFGGALPILSRPGPAVPQDLLVRRHPRHDAREGLAREDHAGLALRASGTELDATLQRGAHPADEHHEDRHRQVAEGEERDRDQDGRPGPHTLEVA